MNCETGRRIEGFAITWTEAAAQSSAAIAANRLTPVLLLRFMLI
jgi:hypothetical protein